MTEFSIFCRSHFLASMDAAFWRFNKDDGKRPYEQLYDTATTFGLNKGRFITKSPLKKKPMALDVYGIHRVPPTRVGRTCLIPSA